MEDEKQKTKKSAAAAILSTFILITALLLHPAITVLTASAATTSMAFEQDWFDLETGTVSSPGLSPPDNASDFQFAYNGSRTPHAVIFQNQSQGVKIAYSDKAYANVGLADVASLSFTTSLMDIAFNKVAVLQTAQGNYFKVGPVSETGASVTFQWAKLLSVTPGDTNGDGVVDSTDLANVGASLNSQTGAPGADLTGDGIVDIYDLVAVGLNYGKTQQ